MNRRSLFARLGTVAAAVALAPAVKVEAASESVLPMPAKAQAMVDAWTCSPQGQAEIMERARQYVEGKRSADALALSNCGLATWDDLQVAPVTEGKLRVSGTSTLTGGLHQRVRADHVQQLVAILEGRAPSTPITLTAGG